MFTSGDLAMLINEAATAFSALPQESRFFFTWDKATIKPLGISFNTITDAVPGFLVPPQSTSPVPTVIGEYVKQDHLELAIPGEYGETIAVDGVVYTNGICTNDRIVGADGTKYKVRDKQRRGYGAYYVLILVEWTGQDTNWLQGQVRG